MNFNSTSPDGGDLPPNHPLVLEALKGIIAGPISELRTKVDNLITNPSNTLQKGSIDYENLLPKTMQNGVPATNRQASFDHTSQITNDILNQISPTLYAQPQPQNIPAQQVAIPQAATPISDPNQPELPLFKPTEISDVYKKLFDIELKLDIIIKHVKGNQNKK